MKSVNNKERGYPNAKAVLEEIHRRVRYVGQHIKQYYECSRRTTI